MATFTTRLNATKPASSENVNITTLNDNSDLFDAAVGSSVGTSASRPASAFSGRLWYTTDSTKLYVNTAATASAVASWADPVANALLSDVRVGGTLSASAGSIAITRSASASDAYTANVTGDTQKRLAVDAAGKHSWSNGASAADTNLYRSAADTLRTDDSLIVGGTTTSIGSMSASTTLTVGGTLTANGGLTVVGKGQKLYLRKAATESLISNTTMQNDNDFVFSLAASATYHLTLFLAVSGGSGDFKSQYVFTGAASGGSHTTRWGRGPASTTTVVSDTTVRSQRFAWTSALSYGTDGSNVSHISEGGIIDTTPGSGTITLQWAQNSSVATSTNVTTDSYAILERLA